jgi:hypothetical protein
MTRTALEIANKLDTWIAKDSRESAAMLRQQHAEIERLTAERETIISDFLKRTGQYVTNNASREYAISSAVAAEREAHAAEIERFKRERHHIYDLLARIHRDGGQYTAEHGVEKACDDAEAQVVTWLATINGIDALIEQARLAEREACAAVCEAISTGLSAYRDGYGASACLEAIRARSAT